MAKSIAEGAMASVLCVLLRTPRKRLGVLHLDRSPWQKPFTMDDLHLADALAANVSAGIECASCCASSATCSWTPSPSWPRRSNCSDEYTGGHTYRVTTYSMLLAEKLDMSPADVDLIRIGTPLHDIGKIGIDDAILRKPDKLTPEEFEIMKTHTVKGAEIIATVPDLRPIIPIVRSHHERWDGKGYPDGLGGEAIHPLARVVALADAFDAMTSDRPYRKGMPAAVAFAEIEKMAGKQFDPVFAAAFLSLREDLQREMQAAGRRRPLHPQTAGGDGVRIIQSRDREGAGKGQEPHPAPSRSRLRLRALTSPPPSSSVRPSSRRASCRRHKCQCPRPRSGTPWRPTAARRRPFADPYICRRPASRRRSGS